MAAEFFYNGRGGKMLAENGYIYEKQHKRKLGGSQVPIYINEKILLDSLHIILLQMWRCVQYHNLRCGHHVLTPTEDDPVGHHEGEPHNHAPNAVKVEAKKLLLQ